MMKSFQNRIMDDVPNALTLAAMKEAESGKDAGVVSTDSLESFITSFEYSINLFFVFLFHKQICCL